MRASHNLHIQGFTFVEFAIALTIIALIGVAYCGQNLIREAQLRSVIKDINTIESAVLTFKEKYYYYPGDMPNATSVWGADAGCPNTPTNTIKKTATCDGDNDGKIDDDFNVPSSIYERYRRHSNS